VGGASDAAIADDAGGRGWFPSNGAPVGELNSIVVDPEIPNAMYVGGYGVYESTDSGGHWTALEVPTSGMDELRDLTFAPSSPNTMYVGGAERGIWKSVDRGTTWSFSESSFKIHALAVDPTNPDIVYAGTWEGNEVGGILPGGLRKSVDGGKTFTPPVALMGSVYRIAVDPVDARSLYIGTSDFLYRSTDGGARAEPTSGPHYTKAIAFDPLDHRIVYASANKGFARTDDAGATWTPYTFSQDHVVQAIAVHPTTKGVVYFGMCCGHLDAEVFRSDDSGATARAVSPPELNVDGVESLAIDSCDPDILYACNRGVIGTTDGGATWAQVGKGMTDLFLTALAIDPETPSREPVEYSLCNRISERFDRSSRMRNVSVSVALSYR